jgi:hypothetical protein
MATPVNKMVEFLASNKNDFTKLSEVDRQAYLASLCETLGLNPMLIPFQFLKLDGKLVLYAKKSCSDQLRSIYGISVVEMQEEERNGVHICRVKLKDKDGREDCDVGAVSLYDCRPEIWQGDHKVPNPNFGKRISQEAEANAILKSATKAKRRTTLSMCGLGMLDETEVESLPGVVTSNEGAKDAAPPAAETKTVTTPPATTAPPGKPLLNRNIATNIQHNILGALDQKAGAFASTIEIENAVKLALEKHEYTADQFSRLMQPLRYEWYRQAAIHADSEAAVQALVDDLSNDLIRHQVGEKGADALLACLKQAGDAVKTELAKLAPKYR